MSYLQGIILGVLQGIAEFLPISSSGHLLVVRNFMELNEAPLLFDILLHLGTLIVICVVYRKRIWDLIGALFMFNKIKTDTEIRNKFKIIIMILISTFITGILGVIIKKMELDKPSIAYALFIVTGVFLFIGKYLKGNKSMEDIGVKEALLVGVSQGIGVLPGISRSGITITTGILGGLKREVASEYSFIIAIPAILGAVVLDLKDAGDLFKVVPVPVMALSFIVTVIIGFFSLKILLKMLNSGKFHYFSFYLIPLGIIGLIFF